MRFSNVSLPEVQKKRGADVDFQTGWAHVSNQAHQVSPRGVSDWWRESVRKSVSVHQYKIRGSAIRQSIHLTRKTSFISPAGTVIYSSLNRIRPPHVFRRRPATPKCRGVIQTSPIARCAAVAKTRAICTFCIPSPNANLIGVFEVLRKAHSVDFSGSL